MAMPCMYGNTFDFWKFQFRYLIKQVESCMNGNTLYQYNKRRYWTGNSQNSSNVSLWSFGFTVVVPVLVELYLLNGARLNSLLQGTILDIHEYAYVIRTQLDLSNHLLKMLSRHLEKSSVSNHEQIEAATAKLKAGISIYWI